MKLENIGFYTLSNKRAENASASSPLQRCELLITSRCNFNCQYCRKRESPDINIEDGKHIIDCWAQEGLVNIRFSGGEPTLCESLLDLVLYAKSRNVKRVAISTNGSANKELYRELIRCGVDDFSISLDACRAASGDEISGTDKWEHTVRIIEYVARYVYSTVGIVVFDENVREVKDTIELAKNLGVHDIRIISAAQYGPTFDVSDLTMCQYPILAYRLNNAKNGKPMRGLCATDNSSCPLVLDDMAVENGWHYPCIIYLRERGAPIGSVGPQMRQERKVWYQEHNCFSDSICKGNCLDVCVDYNNKVRLNSRQDR